MPYKDRVTRLAYLKTYREAHHEQRKAERPYYDMSRHANARARQHNTAGRITVTDVRAIMGYYPTCHYCHGTYLLGLDHVVPLALGGFNIRENLVICCRRCNSSKWQQEHPWQWSRYYTACTQCGTTDSRHVSKGWCNACYRRERYERKGTN